MSLIELAGLFIAVLAVASIVVARLFAGRSDRRRKAYELGHCTRCGYDIRTNARVCPECGEELLDQAKEYWKRRMGE